MTDSVGKTDNTVAKKRALLLKMLEERGIRATPPLVIPKRPQGEPIPLSYAQRRLWYLDRAGAGAAYHMQLALQLAGDLKVDALNDALDALVERHEILRTRFPTPNGSPIQEIAPPSRQSLVQIDLDDIDSSHDSEQDIEAETQRIAVADFERRFDLAEGPLLRATLIVQSRDQHVLLLTLHHSVYDGWALGILIRELTEFYQAFTTGRQADLPELTIQYADFAHWQRGWLEGGALEDQLSYWRKQLAGAAELELPTDRPRPVEPSYRGATHVVMIPADLTREIDQLSQQEGVTPFMTLLAGFQVLVGRYSGQEDVSVGSPIANRNRIELEALVGFFVNSLVLRCDLSGGPTVRELLQRVREVALGAYDHQDLPFEELVRDLQPGRDPSRNPFFQIMFSLEGESVGQLGLSGLSVVSLPRESTTTARFDLEVCLDRRVDEMGCRFLYSTDLFDAETIEQMVGHYIALLSAMVARPDARVSELSLLSSGEERQLLEVWNDTSRPYPSDVCLPALFSKQAQASPDAVAVSEPFSELGSATLSYDELDRRTNQLARYLTARGVGPEVCVGLYADRGTDMIVGILGILKAGGAYVPLDLDYPAERLAFMIEDAGLGVILTHAAHLATLPNDAAKGVQAIYLNSDWDDISACDDGSVPNVGEPDSLAYVIYTSGSTGQPKGVSVSHRSVARLVMNSDYVAFDREDHVAQVSNASFDAATFEIWGALLNGGRLVILPKEVVLEARTFAGALAEHKISAMFLTSALFNQVAREIPDAFASVKHLLVGGEAVDPHWARAVLASGPPTRLLNGYGPTETTTFAVTHHIASVPDGAVSVPIGRPIANTVAYVLDAYAQLVPVGVPGELYIGGDGVARGYLNRPGLTAENFVPNPFGGAGARDGGRLYRTGDRVRRLAGGSIEFLGRVDHQVKLRGFRIELGEIEAALIQHPDVQDAVVIVREDLPGNRRLVGYVVAGDCDSGDELPTSEKMHFGSAFDTGTLRKYLQDRLPGYMLPSAIVPLDMIPLNSNRKIDRESLPIPEGHHECADEDQVAPTTPLEIELANIWCELLELEGVGIHDNFFELGGHSLLATQLVSQIRDSFQADVSLRALFRAPSIDGLANTLREILAEREPVEERAGSRGGGELISDQGAREMPGEEFIELRGSRAIEKRPTGANPLSFAQQRLWYLDQMGAGTAYNMQIALQIEGVLDIEALSGALAAIVERHEVLRTTFPCVNGDPVQEIAPDVPTSLEKIDLSDKKPEAALADLRRIAQGKFAQLFNLASDPLFRPVLVVLGDGRHVLLLTMHHAVYDGWALEIFAKELGKFYRALSQGEALELPDLPIQYADFAYWQRSRVEGGQFEDQLIYWRDQLHAMSQLELPTDRARPSTQSFRGASYSLVLPENITRDLDVLCRREGVTPFMALIAGFQALLARYSGKNDIAVGSPIANRNRSELEGLIGFFVNIRVMRTDRSGDPTVVELLKRVRDVALGAYDHQDLPFEELVRDLQPDRDASRNPLFQVMFSVEKQDSNQVELSGLSLQPLEHVEATTARFDLEVAIETRPQEMVCRVLYSTDLFDPATIERLVHHYAALLSAMVTGPNARISELPLLTASEHDGLIEAGSDTARPYPRDVALPCLFSAQAQQSPDAIALSDPFGDSEFSTLDYAGLERKANQLARYLTGLGVGPEVGVGLYVYRGIEIIVGMLGNINAGGA